MNPSLERASITGPMAKPLLLMPVLQGCNTSHMKGRGMKEDNGYLTLNEQTISQDRLSRRLN
jgi:hypothetical protein